MSWKPQPGPQTEFLSSPLFEVVYGGARGGGKTDAALGDFARHAMIYGVAAKGLLVRRTRVALEPTIARAKQIFGPDGAVWRETKSAFVWPSGAIITFAHLDRDSDADGYQGHAYSRDYVEELTQFANPLVVDKLKAVIRSAQGVPCGFRATCNPGGAGHNWVKARYIDAGPRQPVREIFTNPFDGSRVSLTRVFIPARLTDNPALLQRDPQYVGRLKQSGSEALVKAWLEGDWSSIEGAFFDKWSGRNIIAPVPVPADWLKVRSFDWGYAAPFSVGWWAIASDPIAAQSRLGPVRIPRGAMIRYREWYGSTGRPGEGLRLEAEAVAAGILERECRDGPIAVPVADPSIFSENGGPSIAERMRRVGVAFRRADNTRVGKSGALSGWDQMRARISGEGIAEGAGGGDVPLLYVFDTCRDFIRTVPVLQHDPARPEDLDTFAEDHVADETRYACLSRALPPIPVPTATPRSGWGRPGDELFNEWKVI